MTTSRFIAFYPKTSINRSYLLPLMMLSFGTFFISGKREVKESRLFGRRQILGSGREYVVLFFSCLFSELLTSSAMSFGVLNY